MAEKSDVRPAIVPGEVLTLKDFMYRAKIQRSGWSNLLRQSTASGFTIALKQGRNLYVDTAQWFLYLKSLGAKKSRGTTVNCARDRCEIRAA